MCFNASFIRRWHSPLVSCPIFIFACCSAAPADGLKPAWDVAGYGTLGALYHNQEGIEYRRDLSQGAGAKARTVDFATDSRLGLQLNANVGPRWDVLIQSEIGVTAAGDWRPVFNWALLRYAPSDWMALRIGRLSIDSYVAADSRGVGYSAVMVRPAIEVFGLLPAERFNGADAVLVRQLGSGSLEAKFYGGALRGQTSDGVRPIFDLDGSRIWGGHLQYEYRQWEVRLGASSVRFAHEPFDTSLTSALRDLGTPGAVRLVAATSYRHRRIDFYTASAVLNQNAVQVQLLLSHSHTREPGVQLADVGLFSIAYRWDRWQPYIGYSAAWSDRTLRTTGLSDETSPQVAAINAGSGSLQRHSWDNQQSLAIGVRYDPMNAIALKLQVDQVHFRDSAVLVDHHAAPLQDRTFQVVSAAMDFVF